MLEKCSSILLVSKRTDAITKIEEYCKKNNIHVIKDTVWAPYKAVNEDLIVIDCSLLYDKIKKTVNEKYQKIVVPIYEKGYERCRYDYNQCLLDVTERELSFTFLIEYKSVPMQLFLCEKGSIFEDEEYYFDFAKWSFCYKGEYFYVTKKQGEYLYQWLVLKQRDNKKRGMLFNLRSKLGDEFLSEFNQYAERSI